MATSSFAASAACISRCRSAMSRAQSCASCEARRSRSASRTLSGSAGDDCIAEGGEGRCVGGRPRETCKSDLSRSCVSFCRRSSLTWTSFSVRSRIERCEKQRSASVLTAKNDPTGWKMIHVSNKSRASLRAVSHAEIPERVLLRLSKHLRKGKLPSLSRKWWTSSNALYGVENQPESMHIYEGA